MAEHLDDDEQVEALKRWWDENGRSTLATVVLAIAGTVGWQQYQDWGASQAAVASDLWEDARVLLNAGNPAAVAEGEALAAALKSDHAGSVYAQFAALKLAALAVTEDELETAENELRWALSKTGSQSELGRLVQLRLARVLAARGDETAALAILEQGDGGYAVAYATARGDIHMAAGRDAEALDAYRSARDMTLALGNPAGLLEAKITSLESRVAAEETSS